jgi:ADP-ribose pyrophosphatase YjhB (NUDIX family)
MACLGRSVGIIVLYMDENDVYGLFLKRAKGPMKGKLAFPAGHEEPMESNAGTELRCIRGLSTERGYSLWSSHVLPTRL